MPDHELSPIPEPLRPKPSHESYDGQDIELPPETPDRPPTDRWVTSNQPERKRNSNNWLGTIALLGALVAAGFYTWGGGSTEKQHPNWQHVAAATKASSDSSSQLVTSAANGTAQLVNSVSLSQADLNQAATQRIRATLASGDIATATAQLQAAQQVSAEAKADTVLPDLATNAQLASDLESGRKELFQLELFDCCDEDGDIVEVLVNGQSFATVPIMHAGTTLTIPLSTGDNSIVIRGTRDGGGGVTLGVRTSEGEFFSRYLWVGEECMIGMHVQ